MSHLPIIHSTQERNLSPLIAWRNVLGVTVAAWLLLALPDFGLLTNYLAKTMKQDLLFASFLLDLSFAASSLLLIGLLIYWQRAHGETLAHLGWRRPTTRVALVVGVLFGGYWASSFYWYLAPLSHIQANFLALPWERLIMAPLGILLATNEELLFRGFLMEQLRRASVPTWIQVVVSGICIGSYHGLLGWNYNIEQALFSMVLFSLIALLHILGKRSLTPNITAHALSHLFGDPYAIMVILAAAIHFGIR